MDRRDAYYWRLLATGLCFAAFGLASLVCGLVMFPLMRLWPGSAAAHKRRVRRGVQGVMRTFVAVMRGLGLLTYRFDGTERLGRPGQIIVANHPSLIDVVFLLGFTPSAGCIVKEALFQNPITRWPVAAAGFISNSPTSRMIEGCAQALREGQSVIIFPEGTRTTLGAALQFHRGAANIAVKAAEVVTPVFIRCEPTTLAKNEPWYRIPNSRVHFSLRVGRDIDPEPFRRAAPPVASRAFNDHMLGVFTEELAKAPTDGLNADQ